MYVQELKSVICTVLHVGPGRLCSRRAFRCRQSARGGGVAVEASFLYLSCYVQREDRRRWTRWEVGVDGGMCGNAGLGDRDGRPDCGRVRRCRQGECACSNFDSCFFGGETGGHIGAGVFLRFTFCCYVSCAVHLSYVLSHSIIPILLSYLARPSPSLSAGGVASQLSVEDVAARGIIMTYSHPRIAGDLTPVVQIVCTRHKPNTNDVSDNLLSCVCLRLRLWRCNADLISVRGEVPKI